jgi:hypothetical protein
MTSCEIGEIRERGFYNKVTKETTRFWNCEMAVEMACKSVRREDNHANSQNSSFTPCYENIQAPSKNTSKNAMVSGWSGGFDSDRRRRGRLRL